MRLTMPHFGTRFWKIDEKITFLFLAFESLFFSKWKRNSKSFFLHFSIFFGWHLIFYRSNLTSIDINFRMFFILQSLRKVFLIQANFGTNYKPTKRQFTAIKSFAAPLFRIIYKRNERWVIRMAKENYQHLC